MTNLDCGSLEPTTLNVSGSSYTIFPVTSIPGVEQLPVSLRILLENVLRRVKDPERKRMYVERIRTAGHAGTAGEEIEFMPSRVLFQDFTGVPVFVDFAAMRDEAIRRGGDPASINPQVPCVLVVDHSVTADVVSCERAAAENARIEAERNAERFAFLKWASEHFDNVEIVPPGVGICHQLNIERFCDIVVEREDDAHGPVLCFDSLVGTDSHTPTANGMGVLGWGVGGIEAEAAALGQPVTMTVPPVVGMHMVGKPAPGVYAMDIALTFAQVLRTEGVVGSLVECFGPGVAELSVTQRSTIANMSPEYGCTATLFPPDAEAIAQLDAFGRPSKTRQLAEAYLKAQGLLDVDPQVITYARVLEFDLGAVKPSLAGPSRPHDRLSVHGLGERFRATLKEHGRDADETFTVTLDEETYSLSHGTIAIAAITSCTTATDPSMMLAAGLVAQRACELGCRPRPWVKRIFAPGSHATSSLLKAANLLEPLEQLGFAICGWGCMSCIGNSGPLPPAMHDLASSCEFASVLSGNRNFEGRISPDVAQNYLCAPALVVALSLAGTVDIDLEHDPVCEGDAGPVYLADLLPSQDEVDATLARVVTRDAYVRARSEAPKSAAWDALPVQAGDVFLWDDASTYVRRPTFLEDARAGATVNIHGAKALLSLGDFITTDHISPAGSIAPDSPAARYLIEHGVREDAFNSYGARRGNHEVMMRGTFGNIRLQNLLTPEKQGGWTVDPVSGEATTVYEAACSARKAQLPLIVLAKKMYGSGSSRDWAAKGPALLGVRAVIAESFERIHRSNLIGMGIVPLEFEVGESAKSLGLTGFETYDIEPIDFSKGVPVPTHAGVCARNVDGHEVHFRVKVRVDTATEGAYLEHGGILNYVLDDLLS